MMAPLSLADIARVTGGQVRGSNVHVTSLSTDTRSIERDSAYLALVGERFDGHDFVAAAVERGAAAAIVSRPVSQGIPQVVVDETRLALGQIAALNRSAFKGPVIALTGSCGKTTCKEMMSAILARSHNVLATSGNLNNEIGVPQTLLRLQPEHELAIIEMGAAKAGDIAYLCQFAHPDVTLITNVAPAHLEGFGSLQAVADTKGEIYQALSESGTAVINCDDPFAGQWLAETRAGRIVTVSLDDGSKDFYASGIQADAEGTRFILHTPDGNIQVALPVLGVAMVSNALLSAAAAWVVGAKLPQIAKGLAGVQPVKGRLFIHALEQIRLIDDSYNANPKSVRAAIDVLSSFGGRRVLVLGDMAELGPDSQDMHRDVGAYAAKAGIERVITCGKHSRFAAEAFGVNATHYSDRDVLIEGIDEQLSPGDTILVKGSRSAGMDVVVQVVADNQARRGNVPC